MSSTVNGGLDEGSGKALRRGWAGSDIVLHPAEGEPPTDRLSLTASGRRRP